MFVCLGKHMRLVMCLHVSSRVSLCVWGERGGCVRVCCFLNLYIGV
jgi:hypothetical protein